MKTFDLGHIPNTGAVFRIYRIHDCRNAPHFCDATIYYDVKNCATFQRYEWLTYNQVQRLIKGKPVNKHVVLILTKKKLEDLYKTIGQLMIADETGDTLDDDLMRKYVSKSDIEMLEILYKYEFITCDEDLCLLPLEEQNDWLNADFMFSRVLDAVGYLVDIFDTKFEEGTPDKQSKKKKPLNVGDVIVGKNCSIEITRVYEKVRDSSHHKLYDGINLVTNEKYIGKRDRDLIRYTNNDFPIATVNGVSMTLQKWSKKLGLDRHALRAHYRRSGNDIKAVERLIAHHLKLLDEKKSKYYTRDLVNGE